MHARLTNQIVGTLYFNDNCLCNTESLKQPRICMPPVIETDEGKNQCFNESK